MVFNDQVIAGGLQEGEHRVVHNVQGQHYLRKVLRVNVTGTQIGKTWGSPLFSRRTLSKKGAFKVRVIVSGPKSKIP